MSLVGPDQPLGTSLTDDTAIQCSPQGEPVHAQASPSPQSHWSAGRYGSGRCHRRRRSCAGSPAQARAKVYLTTSVTQWTHYQPNLHSHAGTLYAGRNYFYCWTGGDWYQNNGHTSGAWLRTDDDTGHTNVYVNMVNLSDADFWRAQDLLPQC